MIDVSLHVCHLQEFIVHKFLPEKLLHMARIFKGSSAPKNTSDESVGLLDDEEKEILESAMVINNEAGASEGNEPSSSSSFTFAISVS